jgi:hypothetical protein
LCKTTLNKVDTSSTFKENDMGIPATTGGGGAAPVPEEGGEAKEAGGEAISAEDFDAMEPAEQAKYELGPDGKYHLKEPEAGGDGGGGGGHGGH